MEILDYSLKYDPKLEMVVEGNKRYVFHPITGEKWTNETATIFIKEKIELRNKSN